MKYSYICVMENTKEVATVRKEGVSDSGKPDTAINEGKGKYTVGGDSPVMVNRQFLFEVSTYIGGLNPPDPITGAIMSVGEGISLENAIHIISRMNRNNGFVE